MTVVVVASVALSVSASASAASASASAASAAVVTPRQRQALAHERLLWPAPRHHWCQLRQWPLPKNRVVLLPSSGAQKIAIVSTEAPEVRAQQMRALCQLTTQARYRRTAAGVSAKLPRNCALLMDLSRKQTYAVFVASTLPRAWKSSRSSAQEYVVRSLHAVLLHCCSTAAWQLPVPLAVF